MAVNWQKNKPQTKPQKAPLRHLLQEDAFPVYMKYCSSG